MAKFVIKDARVEVNSVLLSTHANQVTIETEADEVDVTGMGGSFREFIKGMRDVTVTVEFFQDFAGGSVDATLWPLSGSDTPFPVNIRPTSAAISATNPEYQMTALLFSYAPLDGGVGDASSTTVTFRNAAQTGLVRDVTP